MKNIAFLLFFIPFLTFGATTGNFTNGIQNCYQYGVDEPTIEFTFDGGTTSSVQLEATSVQDTYNSGAFRFAYFGSWSSPYNLTLDWTAYDGIPARPWTITSIRYYSQAGGYSASETVDITVQDEECITGGGTATSTATSTASLGDISFGLAIIIALLSLGLIGFAFNSINLKKPWKG